MAEKKHKQIEFIAKCLQNGEQRNEILQKFARSFKTSTRTFDNRLKDAYAQAESTRKAVNLAVTEVIVQEAAEAVRMGLKTDLEIEMQLLKIGFGEMDIIETTTNNNGNVTTYERKPTPAEQRAALETVYKRRGSFAAEKHQLEVVEPIIIEWWSEDPNK
jgi:hypothetical protein